MTASSETICNVLQGEFRISDSPSEVQTTVLGSCVAVCLYDPDRGVGGMNHFLLPMGTNDGPTSMRYGTHAMELLINGLLRRGARRDRLQAKVFGGAWLNRKLNDIGGANAAFARSFLADEDIPIIAQSLGGDSARRVRFWPAAGRAQQMIVDKAQDMPSLTEVTEPPTQKAPDITLF